MRAGRSQRSPPCVPPLGMLLRMRSGHFGENRGNALRRKGMHVVAGGQHLPWGAQSTLWWEPLCAHR